MYFLNLNGLVNHIQTDKNFSKATYNYLLVGGVIGLVSDVITNAVGRNRVPEDLLITLIMALVIAAIGCAIFVLVLSWYHRSNGGNEGEFFADKLIQLGFVIGWRIVIVLIPTLFVVLLAAFAFGSSVGAALFIVWVFLFIAAIIYAVVTMGNSLQKIRAYEVAQKSIAA